MRITVSIDQVLGLAPDIRPAYRDAFGAGQAVLDRYLISATPLRVAHFIAQTLHESAAYTREVENLNYCTERLAVVWGRASSRADRSTPNCMRTTRNCWPMPCMAGAWAISTSTTAICIAAAGCCS